MRLQDFCGPSKGHPTRTEGLICVHSVLVCGKKDLPFSDHRGPPGSPASALFLLLGWRSPGVPGKRAFGLLGWRSPDFRRGAPVFFCCFVANTATYSISTLGSRRDFHWVTPDSPWVTQSFPQGHPRFFLGHPSAFTSKTRKAQRRNLSIALFIRQSSRNISLESRKKESGAR